MMRWYTAPYEKHVLSACAAQEEEEIGKGVGKFWQEQTDHKLVRHLVGNSTRYQGAIRSNSRTRGAREC